MSEVRDPLIKARAARTAQLAKGSPRMPSRAKALRGYYRDLAGVDTCVGPDKRAAIDEYKANVAAAKGKALKALIQSVCFECVGAGADPAPKLRVRDCPIKNCPLHAVRPWQNVSGKTPADIAVLNSKLNTD